MSSTIDEFHKLYYGMEKPQIWEKTYWLGQQTLKCPLDLWIYQEIIFDIKPDFIIETGTWNGGSALFLASICDILGKGNVITVDINKMDFPKHNRITYLIGSSVDEMIVNQVKNKIGASDKVLVILDSDHAKNHVFKEMEIYSQMVSVGSYLIVEDTNINGHPVFPEFGDGPMEAVYEFVKLHDNFIVDKEKEKFLLTFNPHGYLKKIK